MRAVVVALGKIGLPLAVQIARAGHDVVGCDIDPRVVELVNAAREPFPGEAGLAEGLEETVGAGTLRATDETTAAVAEGPELVVAVPPLYVDADAKPDWGTLDAVTDAIGAGLQAGTTVVVETTVPLGATRSRIAPRLEAASGLKEGTDFHLAFSPERVFSGRVFRDLATYPKLVGGLSEEGERRAAELYRQFIPEPAEVWELGGAEAAEMAKLAETTYRDLNIAYANELARTADAWGLDVDKVIDASNSQPFSHIHRPGVAVGGHCIPVYPRFYLEGAPDARLPQLAREVNEAMPAYAIDLLGEVAGKRVLVLGVAYRGGVKETAFSGALALRDELARRGAHAVFADPLYDADELRADGWEPWDGTDVDLAIVQADHPEYATLRAEDVPGATRIVDGRDVLDASLFDGVELRRIGRP
ncbi:MAG TPA: nucleotide sugar dehydrogenase [Solirubrobacteraceae bacterium]|nr:nucleotide sugar dehydrogenase [Solirubrobacteraceae bacterium]